MKSLVVACCAAALLASACSSGGSSKQSASGVLRIGIDAPRSLDPVQATLPSELLIVDQLFDSLTAFDPTTLAAQPSIASGWTMSSDQRHWSFRLRPDARFANGRTITSSDVKYSLERLVRRGTSAAPGLAVQLDVVSGFRAFASEGKAADLAGITTPAPDLVNLDLDQPLASLPELLGSPALGIVPREAVEAPAPARPFGEAPVGSGPFKLKSFVGNVIRLTPVAAGRGTPDIEFNLEADVRSSYDKFTKGELDWSPVPPDRVEEAAERYGRGGFKPYFIEVLYGLNLKSPKFADPRFREAIVRAIDRAAIVKAVYGGTSLPLSALVPRGVPGWLPDACGETCRYDPDGARSLLAQMFRPGTVPDVQIDYDDDPTQEAIAKAMQAGLIAVGIPAGVRPHSFADYLKFASSGKQEIFHFGSSGAYPSQDAFLTPLFLSGQDDNVTQFASGPVDALLKRARADPDPAARMAAYQDAERAVLAAAPVIPIAQYETHTVVAGRVRNLVLTSLGTFDASRVRLR